MEVTIQDIEESTKMLAELSPKMLKVDGIMKAHAVVCKTHGEIFTRSTSCMAPCCFNNGEFILQCDGWRCKNLVKALMQETGESNGLKSNEGRGVRPSIFEQFSA